MKAVVIVDGLNLHHALRDLGPDCANLDVVQLSKRLLPKNCEDMKVFYFTTPPEHLGNDALRTYKRYSRQLTETGVKVVEGRFQRIVTRCKICGSPTLTHREKETDVSIALKIVEAANIGDVEEVLIFSADSDLSPALKLAKRANPRVKISVAQTYAYLRKSHSALMGYADTKFELRESFIHNYQFRLDKN
jgi:uncharacterized LabA/DUF88 family protein